MAPKHVAAPQVIPAPDPDDDDDVVAVPTLVVAVLVVVPPVTALDELVDVDPPDPASPGQAVANEASAQRDTDMSLIKTSK